MSEYRATQTEEQMSTEILIINLVSELKEQARKMNESVDSLLAMCDRFSKGPKVKESRGGCGLRSQAPHREKRHGRTLGYRTIG